MRILSTHDVSHILLNLDDQQLDSLRNSLARALSLYTKQNTLPKEAARDVIQPLRTVMTTSRNITTLTMPVSDTEYTSVKTVTVPPSAPIKGAITVYDAMGELLGLLNAAEVTAFRTALTSMLALSKSKWGRASAIRTPSTDKYHLVVFGGGKQAEWHLRLALRISTIKRATIVNRSLKRLHELEDAMIRDLQKAYADISFETLAQEGNEHYDEQLSHVLSSSDIICCTTPSTSPLFSSKLLRSTPKSRFISLIGSYKPNMQEIDTETLLSGHDGKVIVDSHEACLKEAGELIRADIALDQLMEIGELYSEKIDDKLVDNGQLLAPSTANIIFKCVGLSLMDLAVSKELLDISKRIGVGTEMNDF